MLILDIKLIAHANPHDPVQSHLKHVMILQR